MLLSELVVSPLGCVSESCVSDSTFVMAAKPQNTQLSHAKWHRADHAPLLWNVER